MGGEDFLDDVVALLEGRVLFSLLLGVFFALISGKQNLLADGRAIRDVATNGTGGLVFHSLELCLSCTLEAKAHEAYAEAPYIVFLGRTVELDGEEVFVSVHEFDEQGFLGHAFFVHQSEVGIVEEGHHFVALGGTFGEDLGDFNRFRFGSGVAGRVVREVQEHDLLVALTVIQSGLQGFGIETAVLEGVEGLDLGAAGVFEHELVVVPVQVRDNHFVTGIEEQVAGAADGVGEGAGHDRRAEVLVCKRRVLDDDLLLPFLAEVRVTEARGVQEGLLGQIQGLEDAIQHERRAIVFEGGANRSVDLGALGFGALAEDSLAGEENRLALFREHIENFAAVCGKFCIESLC